MTPISPVYANIASTVAQYKWNIPNKNNPKTMDIDFQKDMPWVRDNVLTTALSEINELTFAPEDIRYMEAIGIHLPFKSGKECVEFIEKENIRLYFAKPFERGVHAQYSFDRNAIMINKKYQNTKDFAIMLAIGEAILHEAGHAKDKDGQSSVQEELNFLGMNAVAHRAFIKKYGKVFSNSTAPIVADGVSIYEKLFFDPDPDKKRLIARMKEKYGDLPSGDRLHPPGKIARAVLQ